MELQPQEAGYYMHEAGDDSRQRRRRRSDGDRRRGHLRPENVRAVFRGRSVTRRWLTFLFFSAGEWLTRTKIRLLIERLLAGISDGCRPTDPNLCRCGGAEYWPILMQCQYARAIWFYSLLQIEAAGSLTD